MLWVTSVTAATMLPRLTLDQTPFWSAVPRHRCRRRTASAGSAEVRRLGAAPKAASSRRTPYKTLRIFGVRCLGTAVAGAPHRQVQLKCGAQAPHPKRRRAAALHTRRFAFLKCGASAPLSRLHRIGLDRRTQNGVEPPHSIRWRQLLLSSGRIEGHGNLDRASETDPVAMRRFETALRHRLCRG